MQGVRALTNEPGNAALGRNKKRNKPNAPRGYRLDLLWLFAEQKTPVFAVHVFRNFLNEIKDCAVHKGGFVPVFCSALTHWKQSVFRGTAFLFRFAAIHIQAFENKACSAEQRAEQDHFPPTHTPGSLEPGWGGERGERNKRKEPTP